MKIEQTLKPGHAGSNIYLVRENFLLLILGIDIDIQHALNNITTRWMGG